MIGHDLSPTTRPGFDAWMSGPLDDDVGAAAVVDAASPDLVVHLAGRFRGTTDEIDAANVGTTRALLRALAGRPDCRLVVAGSAAEYGPPIRLDGRLAENDAANPTSSYGQAKLAATALVLADADRGRHAVVARLFNVIGPGMSPALFLGALVARLRDALRTTPLVAPKVAVGNLDVRRDFVAVEDAGEILARLVLDSAAPRRLCNVASGVAAPLTDITEALAAASGVAVLFERDEHFVRTEDPPVIVGDIARLRSWVVRVPTPDLRRVVAATWAAA